MTFGPTPPEFPASGDYPMDPVSAPTGAEWARRLLPGGADLAWTMKDGQVGPDALHVDPGHDISGWQQVRATVTFASGRAPRRVGAPESPMPVVPTGHVVSYICVTGSGAPYVSLNVTERGEPFATLHHYEGWDGTHFRSGTAVPDAQGNHWYRLEIDWSALLSGRAQTVLDFWASMSGEIFPTHKDLPFRLWAYTGHTNTRWVVEAFGQRGILEFDGRRADRPTTGTITFTGTTPTLRLTNGRWSAQEFTADVAGGPVAGAPAIEVIRLMLDSGAPMAGVMGRRAYVPGSSWVVGAMTLVLAHEWAAGQTVLRPPAPDAAKHVTVVFDRTGDADPGAPTRYSYGWWRVPSVTTTPTFSALTLLWDSMRGELALYRFPNTAPIPSGPSGADLDPYKVRRYDYRAIERALGSRFDSFNVRYVFPELAARLIAAATEIAPSDLVGISSSGHGSPDGIMNGILWDSRAIKQCFAYLAGARGRPVDFLDFGTNCNVASLSNLEALAPYASWVLASDLTRSSPTSAIGRRPDDAYDSYYSAPGQDARSILSAMMDAWDAVWNDAGAVAFYSGPQATTNSRTVSSWRQQLTLFDCSRLAPILAGLHGAEAFSAEVRKLDRTQPDVFYDDDRQRYANLTGAVLKARPTYAGFAQDWARFAVKQVNNRRSLPWGTATPRGVLVR